MRGMISQRLLRPCRWEVENESFSKKVECSFKAAISYNFRSGALNTCLFVLSETSVKTPSSPSKPFCTGPSWASAMPSSSSLGLTSWWERTPRWWGTDRSGLLLSFLFRFSCSISSAHVCLSQFCSVYAWLSFDNFFIYLFIYVRK